MPASLQPAAVGQPNLLSPNAAPGAQPTQGSAETRAALAQSLGIPPEQAKQLAADPAQFQAALAKQFKLDGKGQAALQQFMAQPQNPQAQAALTQALAQANPNEAPQIQQAVQQAAKQSEAAKDPFEAIKNFFEGIGKALGLGGSAQGQDKMQAGQDPRAPATQPNAGPQPPSPTGGDQQPGAGGEQPEGGAAQRRGGAGHRHLAHGAGLHSARHVGGHKGAVAVKQLKEALAADPTGKSHQAVAAARAVEKAHVGGAVGRAAHQILHPGK